MTHDDATLRQIEAADPVRSTWLSANAGSGKTRVLTDRVARLLLNGTRPENVLCLTYTKAAASEMQNRLFKRLGEWAMMPDSALRQQLRDLGAEQATSGEDLRHARTLFAAALETPGGLKIQTIHSFCAGVLRRFPLEAEVSPQFREMEDRTAQLLREEVLDEMALGEHAGALAGLAQHYSGGDLYKILSEISGRKEAFANPPSQAELSDWFDLPPDASPEDAVNIAFCGGEDGLADDLADACKALSKTYATFATNLQSLNLKTPDMETLTGVFSLLLYADKTSKSRNWPQSNHKAAVAGLEHLTDDVHAWMDRTAEAYDYLRRLKALDKTRALFAFAAPFIRRYETKKLHRAALDFDDLINKARALLQDPAVAQWVLFRLDGGVDHVLVDEAQDTSPAQWEVVRLLTQEFSTGEGAHPDRERTVFVVGDKKQSIYSFQGADPEGFDRMRDHFSGELEKVQKELQDKELLYSFRSSEAILSLVDQTFVGEMKEGLGDHIHHKPFKSDMPGRVDLWPVIEKDKSSEGREWDDPVDLEGRTNHNVILAHNIATEIKRMLAEETLPDTRQADGVWSRRRITPGDILILVQGRTTGVFQHIISVCKAAGLDVAGADQLKLGGELAVKDISAVLQFLALQDDDLSLAAALKSPLFGWTEKQLYDLAQPRRGKQTLWEALRRSGQHEDTLAILYDLRNQADFLRPYDLINRLLIRHGGRHNLLARLGHEAEDGIDALLSQALGYEQSAVPSLTGFLSWLQTEDVTVKRQMDTAGDRIRVMTVHGSKGLEAPIVILPDTAKRSRDLKSELMTSGGQVFWKPAADDLPNLLAEVKEEMLTAQDRERRRLLYVAMTRAENWLIVAGAGDMGKDDSPWHRTISNAMDHLDAVEHSNSVGQIKRFSRHDWDAGPLVERSQVDAPQPPTPTFGDTLPAFEAPRPTRAPSDLGGAKILPDETHTEESEPALAWGRIIHLLLEVLPPLPAHDRADTGLSLTRNHPDAGLIPDHAELVQEALDLIEAPDLSWVFSQGLAEVPISANLASLGGDRLYGLIDRLIVSEDEVIAVDYKSNRSVPDTPDKTPVGLVRQMAAYRDALRVIYPDRRVRVVLLWTRNGTVSELDDAALDHALAGVSLP
ncbi:double-strand break repair helicase AddA [Thalassorhabdomicrobium marinisediminis]|uniref:DNA 3'-5' helicase n=1 Tax=Thalassorhabdomicrobium marinisediminis TaxID=2170577 RepID=A0A2T7FZQ9_9RHOB|nr:double-strand break repair helicase AddA [Thalassorhabdomicrobium marinisediminis]PVA07645.1 double-strand break repair helicase AddA [Thalassorhabdomicrobium marinisediminis]